MVYLVSYDLNAPEKDYQRLFDAIEHYDKPCRILKSQWLIRSDKSAEEIFNELIGFIDENDELFVCEITKNHFGTFKAETVRQVQVFFNQTFAHGLLG